jgi:hypothetical protein
VINSNALITLTLGLIKPLANKTKCLPLYLSVPNNFYYYYHHHHYYCLLIIFIISYYLFLLVIIAGQSRLVNYRCKIIHGFIFV